MSISVRAFISLFLILGSAAVSSAPIQKKNVLMISLDDVISKIGVYGNPIVQTPNIDKLMAMGVRFTNAHANWAMSNPSRTSFLSGVYPESTRIYGNLINPRTYLGPDWVMLNEHFDNNGYFTARYGKVAYDTWGAEYRWDVVAPDFTSKLQIAYQGGTGRWIWQALLNDDADIKETKGAKYMAGLMAEARTEPFFIAVGLSKAHTPWIVPKKYFDMYPPSSIKLPLELGEPADDANDIPKLAIGKTPCCEWAALGTDDQRRQGIAAAYAAISFVDAEVGILIDAMTANDLWKNTIVILFSDHGYALGEHGGTVGKGMLTREATQIPMTIVAPGMAVNKASNLPVELVDVYPTLAELAGLPIPAELEGKSLAGILANPAAVKAKRPAYSVIRRSYNEIPSASDVFGRSIRTQRYRYTEWDAQPTQGLAAAAELYDLVKDPKEYTNLIDKPEYAALAQSLKQQLSAAKARPRMRLR